MHFKSTTFLCKNHEINIYCKLEGSIPGPAGLEINLDIPRTDNQESESADEGVGADT